MKSFLPQDTLSIDVMSLGVLVMLFTKAAFFTSPFPHIALPDLFWLPMIACFALLAIKQIMLNKLTPIKALLQWVFGVFFTWLSLNSHQVDTTMLVLGLSNLYACIINFNLIKETLGDDHD